MGLSKGPLGGLPVRQGSVGILFSERRHADTHREYGRSPDPGWSGLPDDLRVETAVVAVDSRFPGLAAPPQGQHKGYSPLRLTRL